MGRTSNKERLLLINTCSEDAALGLSEGSAMVCSCLLADRTASALVISALRDLLEAAKWSLADMDGIGVVNGPGSFTGMRTGLAAAKGLCEATGLRLAVASRLAVLAKAAELRDGFAVLNAGRDELYVREVRGEELLGERIVGASEFLENAHGESIVIAEVRLAERLAALRPRLKPMRIEDALGPLLSSWRAGGVDTALVDANYVRGEQEIYRKSETAAKAGA